MSATSHMATQGGQPEQWVSDWTAVEVIDKIITSKATITLSIDGGEVIIHEDLLRYFSRYFDAALKGSFGKRTTGLCPITGHEEHILGVVISWMYTGQLLHIFADSDEERIDRLIALFHFADEFDILALRIEITRQVFRYFEFWCKNKSKYSLPSLEQVDNLFSNVPPTASLCRLFSEMYILHWDENTAVVDDSVELSDSVSDFLAFVIDRQVWWAEQGAAKLKPEENFMELIHKEALMEEPVAVVAVREDAEESIQAFQRGDSSSISSGSDYDGCGDCGDCVDCNGESSKSNARDADMGIGSSSGTPRR